jgi:HlyD family secretion protein
MSNKINTDRSLRFIQIAGYLSLLVAGGVVTFWGTASRLSGAVIAPATLVSDTLSKRVQHREGGIVAAIKVKNGDRVTEGQEIITLDPTETASELNVITSALDEFRVRGLRLEAQRDGENKFALPKDIAARKNDPALAQLILGQQKLLTSTLDGLSKREGQLKNQIVQLEEQMSGTKSQKAARLTQLGISKRELKQLEALKKQGLVANNRLNDSERSIASIEGEIGQLDAALASAQTKISEVRLQILQIADDTRTQALTELRDVEARITELSERKMAVQPRLSRMAVKAPITGIVYELAVNTLGGVIAPGEVLMLIAPEGEELVLQAQISPNDVDQVHAGQSARVRFSGFNTSDTPEIAAVVLNVAANTTQSSPELPPFYAVRLTISKDEVKRLGDNALRPGMVAETFIETESRSPLNYLLKPLIDMIPRTFRES